MVRFAGGSAARENAVEACLPEPREGVLARGTPVARESMAPGMGVARELGGLVAFGDVFAAGAEGFDGNVAEEVFDGFAGAEAVDPHGVFFGKVGAAHAVAEAVEVALLLQELLTQLGDLAGAEGHRIHGVEVSRGGRGAATEREGDG